MDLAQEKSLINFLLAGQSLFDAAHDLSNGGLAAAISEMVLRHGIGAKITVESAGIQLFVETPGRVIVAVNTANAEAVVELAQTHGVEISSLGSTGGDALCINDSVIPILELRAAFEETFPKLFG